MHVPTPDARRNGVTGGLTPEQVNADVGTSIDIGAER